jgi:hypothetical protein
MKFWFLVILFGSLPLMGLLLFSIIWFDGLIRKFRKLDRIEAIVRNLTGGGGDSAENEALSEFQLLTPKLQADVIRAVSKQCKEAEKGIREHMESANCTTETLGATVGYSSRPNYHVKRGRDHASAFRSLLSLPNRDWLTTLPTDILLTLSRLEDVTKVWTDVIYSRMTEDEEYTTRTDTHTTIVLCYHGIQKIAKDELTRRNSC